MKTFIFLFISLFICSCNKDYVNEPHEVIIIEKDTVVYKDTFELFVYKELVNSKHDSIVTLNNKLDSVKSKYEELFGVTQKGFEYNLAKEFSKDITRVNKEIETALIKLGIAEQNNNDVEKKLWEERLSRYQETQKQIKKIIELKGLEREADLAKA